MRHCVRVKHLATQRWPQKAFLTRPLHVLFRQARHDLVADQDRTPFGGDGFPIHRLPARDQRILRRQLRRRDIEPVQSRRDPPDKSGMMRSHQFTAQKEALRVADGGALLRRGGFLLVHLLDLFLGQNSATRPENEIGRLPAHGGGPKPQAFVENILQINSEFVGDMPARVHVDALNFTDRLIRIRQIPSDDGVAFILQRAGQIQSQRRRQPLDVGARRHPFHAADADKGQVIALLRHKRIAVRGLQVAIAGKRLFQRQ